MSNCIRPAAIPRQFVGWVLFALLIVIAPIPRKICAVQVQDETKIALSGFSLSEAFSIEDNQPFEIEETNLLKLVYRLWQTSLSNLENYSRYTSAVSWEKLLADPPGFRLQVFETVGRAKSVERISLPNAEEDPRYVYRIKCHTEQGHPFELLSLSVPQAWLGAQNLDQPVSSLGFFFAMLQTSSTAAKPEPVEPEPQPAAVPEGATQALKENRVPLFLAKQVSWRPSQPDPALGIEPDHVLLAQQGVDIAALDQVRREDRKRLGSLDARPFYQFLHAVAAIGKPSGVTSLSHMELLRNPAQSHGRHLGFRARVKKCSIVRPPEDPASNPAKQKESIEQYFQLIVFPDLRDSRDEPTVVEIGRGEDSLAYRRFPFTFCCRELPPGMTPESIENQQVWIDGFYFRFWLYDAERTTTAGVTGQLSPLIIGNRPEMLESDFGSLEKFFSSLLLIFVAVLAIVAFTIFRIARRVGSNKEALPEKLDVDSLAEM